MASKNDITLDVIATRVPSKDYTENYDKIDHSIKWTPDSSPQTVRLAKSERYLIATPEKHSLVSMNYHHPDHNLKLVFDQEGTLIEAMILK